MTKKKEPTPKLKCLAPHIIVVINCYIWYKFILFYCRIFHNYAVRLKTQKKIVKRTVYFMYLHLSTTLIYTWLISSRNQRCKLICLLLKLKLPSKTFVEQYCNVVHCKQPCEYFIHSGNILQFILLSSTYLLYSKLPDII